MGTPLGKQKIMNVTFYKTKRDICKIKMDVLEYLSIIAETEDGEKYLQASKATEEWMTQPTNIAPTIELMCTQENEKIQILLLSQFRRSIDKMYDIISSSSMYPAIIEQFIQTFSVESLMQNTICVNNMLEILAYLALNNIGSFCVIDQLDESLKFRFLYYFLQQMNNGNLNHKKVEVSKFMQENLEMFVTAMNDVDVDDTFLRYAACIIESPEGQEDLQFLTPYAEKIISGLVNPELSSAAYTFISALTSKIIDPKFTYQVLITTLTELNAKISESTYPEHIIRLWEAIITSSLFEEMEDSLEQILTIFFEQIPSIVQDTEEFAQMIDNLSFEFSQIYENQLEDLYEFGESYLNLIAELVNTNSEIMRGPYIKSALIEIGNAADETIEMDEYLQGLFPQPAFFFFVAYIGNAEQKNSSGEMLLSLEEKPSTTMQFLHKSCKSFEDHIPELFAVAIELFPKDPLLGAETILEFTKKNPEVTMENVGEVIGLLQGLGVKEASYITQSLFCIIPLIDVDASEFLSSIHSFIVQFCQQSMESLELTDNFLKFMQNCISIGNETTNEQANEFYHSLYSEINARIEPHSTEEGLCESISNYFVCCIRASWCPDLSTPLEYACNTIAQEWEKPPALYYLLQNLIPAFPNETIFTHFLELDMNEQIHECCYFLDLAIEIIKSNSSGFFEWFPFDFIMHFFDAQSFAIINRLLNLIKLMVPYIDETCCQAILGAIFEHLKTNFDTLQSSFGADVIFEITSKIPGPAIAEMFAQTIQTECRQVEEICQVLSQEEINKDRLTFLIKNYNSIAKDRVIVLKPSN